MSLLDALAQLAAEVTLRAPASHGDLVLEVGEAAFRAFERDVMAVPAGNGVTSTAHAPGDYDLELHTPHCRVVIRKRKP